MTVLFNNAFNTLYLWLYGVRHMVKDHWDSKRGNPLPPLHGLLFQISSKGSLYRHHPVARLAHTTTFVKPVAVTRNSSMGPPWRIDPTTHCTMSFIMELFGTYKMITAGMNDIVNDWRINDIMSNNIKTWLSSKVS